MVTEYIERKALKKTIHASDLDNREKTALLLCVGSAPAADVAPVVHGRWIYQSGPDDNGNIDVECSACHHGDCHALTTHVPYCWFCGAKMDGEGETDA